MGETLLEVSHLKTYFYSANRVVPAVDDVSFRVEKGKTLGIVGESGSGKSVAVNTVMRLIQSPPGRILSGSVRLEGNDLLKKSQREMRAIRGRDIAMVFQDPMTSLDPLFPIGHQIAEAIRAHEKLQRKESYGRALQLLRQVGIPAAEKRIHDYPFKLSGGMRQRAMIAVALACRPRLLIADEPTTALDVTIQAQILELINDMKRRLSMSMLIISHDLGVIARTADTVAVMYAGKIMEYGSVRDILLSPKHPYTAGLVESIRGLKEDGRLPSIRGSMPRIDTHFRGCRFASRCPFAAAQCRESEPDLREAGGRSVRCFRFEGQG